MLQSTSEMYKSGLESSQMFNTAVESSDMFVSCIEESVPVTVENSPPASPASATFSD